MPIVELLPATLGKFCCEYGRNEDISLYKLRKAIWLYRFWVKLDRSFRVHMPEFMHDLQGSVMSEFAVKIDKEFTQGAEQWAYELRSS
jgi:hypothetical protein